ncbi:unannotated protein [freshwater metagenome]|uniref:Unannotated protein n=1 Tax=freshwater metagenome TaxID=449393 RepID=A0A6J7UM88_9ZZZZ|nr:hypothetical protein [Actinomycetota bacterium]MTH93633.1 hypothetical protein [Actinomycetota bacterium]
MKNHYSYRVAIVRAVGIDARQLNALAQEITAIAPLIEIVDDEHVLVPMRGPTRYFGGEKAVAEQLFSCAPEHVVLTIGIADGRLAGLIAARMAQPLFVVPAGETAEFLANIDVRHLEQFVDVSANTLSLLFRLGLSTCGKVAATSKQLLADRFGPDGNMLHTLCGGADLHPALTEKIPTLYYAESDYEEPLVAVETVLASVQQLIAPLMEKLQGEHLAMCRVVVTLTTEHDDISERVWYSAAGFHERGLLERVRWQVTTWLEESSGLTAGVHNIAVNVQNTVPIGHEQPRLWGGRSESDAAARMAIARVAGVVGQDHVRVPEWRGGRDITREYELVPAHRVDLVRHDATVHRVTPGVLRPALWSGDMGQHAPMLNIFPPEKIEVLNCHHMAVEVSGRHHVRSEPQYIRRHEQLFSVRTWHGPWPVEERWWDPLRQRRVVRMQCLVDDGEQEHGWLVMLEHRTWWLVAVYS